MNTNIKRHIIILPERSRIEEKIRIYEQIDSLINDIFMPATRKILSAYEIDEIFNEFLDSNSNYNDHYYNHKLSNEERIEAKQLCNKAFTVWLLFNWCAYKGNKSIIEIHMEDEELMSLLNTGQKKLISQILISLQQF